jgi:hypothetical protein
VIGLALACLAGAPARVGAQAAGDTLPPAGADATMPRAEPLPVPPKPSVHEFRVAAEVSAFNWDEEAQVDDGVLFDLDVERNLASFLAARGGLAYGTSEARPRSGEGPPSDVRLYLPELNLMLQHELRVGTNGWLTPYAVAGFGSLVADPEGEGSTRSQNAFSYGGGARMRMGDRFGGRAEIKRYEIKAEDPLDPVSRSSETVHSWRLGGALTYAL